MKHAAYRPLFAISVLLLAVVLGTFSPEVASAKTRKAPLPPTPIPSTLFAVPVYTGCPGCPAGYPNVPCLPIEPSPTLVAYQGGVVMEYALVPSEYGMRHFRAKNFPCAYRYFESAYLSSGRMDATAAYNAAVSALEMNQRGLAGAWIQRALYANPEYTPAWDLRIRFNLW